MICKFQISFFWKYHTSLGTGMHTAKVNVFYKPSNCKVVDNLIVTNVKAISQRIVSGFFKVLRNIDSIFRQIRHFFHYLITGILLCSIRKCQKCNCFFRTSKCNLCTIQIQCVIINHIRNTTVIFQYFLVFWCKKRILARNKNTRCICCFSSLVKTACKACYNCQAKNTKQGNQSNQKR